jgi:flagellar hook-length control protein FliK
LQIMSQTNIDYLFQTAAAATRTPVSGSRRKDDLPAFGEHLNLASGTTGEKANKPADSNKPPQHAPPASDVQNNTAEYSFEGESAKAASQPAETAKDSHRANADAVAEEDAGETATKAPEAGEEVASENEEHDPQSEVAEAVAVDTATVAVDIIAVAVDDTTIASPAEATGAAEEVDASVAVSSKNEADAHADQEPAAAAKSTQKQTTEAAHSANTGDESILKQQLSGELADASSNGRPLETADEKKAKSRDNAGRGRENRATPSTAAIAEGDTTREGSASIPVEAHPSDGTSNNGPVASADEPPRDAEREPSRHFQQNAVTSKTKIPAAAIVDAAASPANTPAAPTEGGQDTAQQLTNSTAPKPDTLTAVLGRAQSGSAAAAHTRGTFGENDLPRVDPARFIGRVSKAFHTAQDRGGTLQLRLAPPELGSLRLELTVKEGVMTAALETETTAARRMLLDHLPALRERLAEQNIRVERFDVDVRREGSGNQADDRAAQQQQHQQNHGSDQPPARRRAASQLRAAEPVLREEPALPLGGRNSQINLMA